MPVSATSEDNAVPVQAMEVYGAVETYLHAFPMRVVRFTPRPLYLRGIRQCPLGWRLCTSHSRSRRFGEVTPLPGSEPRFVGRLTRLLPHLGTRYLNLYLLYLRFIWGAEMAQSVQ